MNTEVLQTWIDMARGKSTPVTNAIGNFTNSWTNTFGDGSWNNPSEKGFWKVGENPDETKPYNLPSDFSPVKGTDSFANPTNFPQFGQPAGNNQPMQMNPNPYGIEHLLGLPQSTQKVAAKPQVQASPATGPSLADIMAQQKALGVTQDGILGPQTRQAQAISNYQDAIIAGADPSTLQSPYSDNMWETNRMENQLATPTAPLQGTSFMDGWNDFFGTDATVGDLAGGVGSLVTGGLGAYGMFESLDQGQERIDQGWANYDLNKRQVDEHLREKAAIKEASKGW